MKLRLSGTRDECVVLAGALADRLAGLAQVVEISGFYPNRGSSVLGRVYAELRLSPEPPAGTDPKEVSRR